MQFSAPSEMAAEWRFGARACDKATVNLNWRQWSSVGERGCGGKFSTSKIPDDILSSNREATCCYLPQSAPVASSRYLSSCPPVGCFFRQLGHPCFPSTWLFSPFQPRLGKANGEVQNEPTSLAQRRIGEWLYRASWLAWATSRARRSSRHKCSTSRQGPGPRPARLWPCGEAAS